MRGTATTAAAAANTNTTNNNNNNPTTNWTGTNATTTSPNQGWFVGAPLTRFGLYMLWISFLCLELNGWHNKVSVGMFSFFPLEQKIVFFVGIVFCVPL
jgi:hypothetical protein